MSSWLFSFLFSWVGSLGVPALLVCGAVALAWFGFKDLAKMALVAAGVWFVAGMLYQDGIAAEAARWQREAQAEINRQVAARQQVEADASRAAAASAKTNEEMAEKVRVITSIVDNSCLLSPEDQKKLEEIR